MVTEPTSHTGADDDVTAMAALAMSNLDVVPTPTTISTTNEITTTSTLSPFATAFLALPPELRTFILSFLTPDDLGVLSRVVAPLEGIERDHYLWTMWISKTAPSRVGHALFSPLRPNPLELVRRGTLRGLGVISGIRSGGYWASPDAVRLSTAYDRLTRTTLRRSLSTALSTRPSRLSLVVRGILPPSAGRSTTSASICARVYSLDQQLARHRARRALRASGVGSRYVPDHLESSPRWHGAGRAERVLLALCPGIRERRRFFEGLAVGV